MGAADAPKDMLEQIAEDASLDLVPGSKYDSLIPFLWDDSRRTEHHGEMVKGLRRIDGVADVAIIPRPGSMRSWGPPKGEGAEAGSKPKSPIKKVKKAGVASA